MANKNLKAALLLRERYMSLCNQSFPSVTSKYIRPPNAEELAESQQQASSPAAKADEAGKRCENFFEGRLALVLSLRMCR